MTDSLFPTDGYEIPLLREPRARKGAAAGSWVDARFQNDYPPDWDRCTACNGTGRATYAVFTYVGEGPEFPPTGNVKCGACLGMGSLKARVRLEAGHRCLRCLHPYMPGDDAKMLGVEPSGMQVCPCGGGHPDCRDCKGTARFWTPWSACDKSCTHGAPVRFQITPRGHWFDADEFPLSYGLSRTALTAGQLLEQEPGFPGPAEVVEAEWRILTVHHLDGDKANCRWWNLASLCQRCHLEVQAKVVMERVWAHEHSEWFKPFAAGYYAFVYLCAVCGCNTQFTGAPSPRPPALDAYPHMCRPGLELTREQTMERLDELLALERIV